MMPESIVTLANCNKRIVATLVGKLDCSTADLWNNWDMCRQAGLLYMRDFFNQTRYEMFEI
jgi:hypothetical protein